MTSSLKKIGILICAIGMLLTGATPLNYGAANSSAKKVPVVYSEYYTVMDQVQVPTFLVDGKEAIAVETLSQLNYAVTTDKAKKVITIDRKPDANKLKSTIQPLSFMKETKIRGTVFEQATLSTMKVLMAGVPVTAFDVKGKTIVLINDLGLLGESIKVDKATRTIVIGNSDQYQPLPVSGEELFFSTYTLKDFERLFGKAKQIKSEYGNTTAEYSFGEVSINSSSVTVSLDSDRANDKKVPSIIRNIDMMDSMESVFAKFPKVSGDTYKVGSQKGDVIYWTSPADMRRFTINDRDFMVQFNVRDKNKVDEIFIRAKRFFPKANDSKVALEDLITMRDSAIGSFFKMDYATYSSINNDGDGVYLKNDKVYIAFGNDRPNGFMTYNKKHSVYNVNLDMTEAQMLEVLKNRFPGLKLIETGKDSWNSAEEKEATYKSFELNDFKHHYFKIYFDAKTKKIVAIGTFNGNN